MKNYTVFYGETNTAYSFKAVNDVQALAFCESYFSVPTSVMTIIENVDVNMKCEFGRLVFTNNKFIVS